MIVDALLGLGDDGVDELLDFGLHLDRRGCPARQSFDLVEGLVGLMPLIALPAAYVGRVLDLVRSVVDGVLESGRRCS